MPHADGYVPAGWAVCMQAVRPAPADERRVALVTFDLAAAAMATAPEFSCSQWTRRS